ncbi:MAG: hypothetical protein H0U76_12035 [Ktedonobacteraceae bacterium]|nr:hypothetical protein [Ktedonobacteraceae bacterium]
MMGSSNWPYRAPRVELRSQGGEPGVFHLDGANHPDRIQEMAERKIDISIINPSVLLTMAYRGSGAFEKPTQVATIAVMPHYDQLGFAVTETSGIRSLDQIREQRFPLRVSVRGSLDASTTMLVDVVLKAHGFSLKDIVSWGGHVSYDQPMPNDVSRIGRVKSGELDAIFEEGIVMWGNIVSEAGMHFLPIDEPHLAKLEAQGFRRAMIKTALYPSLPTDVPTVDFSGWPIFTHRDASDLLIRDFCEALEARKQRIQWRIGDANQPPLPLEQMCKDTEETPLDVPFHPAAERFWRERGYL